MEDEGWKGGGTKGVGEAEVLVMDTFTNKESPGFFLLFVGWQGNPCLLWMEEE